MLFTAAIPYKKATSPAHFQALPQAYTQIQKCLQRVVAFNVKKDAGISKIKNKGSFT
jgi:hypothetical protein